MESLRSEGEEKLALLLIGQSSYRWLEKMLTLERKLPAESVLRGRIDFSYLPVVGTKTTCLFEGLYITET